MYDTDFAGFCASTCTNPIWLVKTRLQLDRATGEKTMTVSQCVRKIFNTNVSQCPEKGHDDMKGVTEKVSLNSITRVM